MLPVFFLCECRNLPDKRISGRILKDRDSGSGAAITVDGSALRYTSVYRVREHFLNMKKSLNPTRREG